MNKINIDRWFQNGENPDCYEQLDDRPELNECKYCGLEAKYECDLISGNFNQFDSLFGIHLCEDCYNEVKSDYYVERCDEIE